MGNETEIQKLHEMINDYKRGKLKMNGFELDAIHRYLVSLEKN